MMDKPMVVITTTGSEPQAITIAEELVQSKFSASVNIIPGMRTIYRFNGKIFDDEETMLIIKTVTSSFDGIVQIIKQLHTYEIPEIFSFHAAEWDQKFFEWLSRNSVPSKHSVQTEEEIAEAE